MPKRLGYRIMSSWISHGVFAKLCLVMLLFYDWNKGDNWFFYNLNYRIRCLTIVHISEKLQDATVFSDKYSTIIQHTHTHLYQKSIPFNFWPIKWDLKLGWSKIRLVNLLLIHVVWMTLYTSYVKIIDTYVVGLNQKETWRKN